MVWIFYAIDAATDTGDPGEPGARLCAHLPGEWCRRCADAHRRADDRPFTRRRAPFQLDEVRRHGANKSAAGTGVRQTNAQLRSSDSRDTGRLEGQVFI
jgi:hypothetical protein